MTSLAFDYFLIFVCISAGGNYVSFKNETFITQMYYNITTTFADNMFKSCQHVTNPSTNAPAINMLCGPNADKCTAEVSYLKYNCLG